MEEISVGLIVVIIIIGLAELALVIWALIDIIRRPTTSALPRWAWAIIVIFFNLLGPILYIAIGRRSDTTVDRYANDPIVPPEYLRPQPIDGQVTAAAQNAAPAPALLQSQTPAAPLQTHTTSSPPAAAEDAGNAGGGEAAPPAPEAAPGPAPDAPDAPEPGQSRAERTIDTLYGQEQPRE